MLCENTFYEYLNTVPIVHKTKHSSGIEVIWLKTLLPQQVSFNK
jgi:hypothetical protein